ncbi:MAG: sporulation protein YqfC [Oscillospiraceae bacterium]|jgi:sporulation protein YqfC|nr:sporulation protein YqfC [Oscillospiraceae bacterium]
MFSIRKKTIRSAQQLGLPEDVLLGMPRIVLRGNTSLTLENHKGILEYTDKRVRLRTSIGTLIISGSALNIVKMGRNDLMMRGRIDEISYETFKKL